jgi:hypothetical protein
LPGLSRGESGAITQCGSGYEKGGEMDPILKILKEELTELEERESLARMIDDQKIENETDTDISILRMIPEEEAILFGEEKPCIVSVSSLSVNPETKTPTRK